MAKKKSPKYPATARNRSPISITLPGTDAERLAELALSENRNRSNMAAVLITEGLSIHEVNKSAVDLAADESRQAMSITLPVDLHDKLCGLAEKEKRTRSNMVAILIAEGLSIHETGKAA